jgi:hypothetical protein
MAYRTPGAYARFVKAANSVASARDARTVAIIGTGETAYDVVNEAVYGG